MIKRDPEDPRLICDSQGHIWYTHMHRGLCCADDRKCRVCGETEFIVYSVDDNAHRVIKLNEDN